MLLAQRGEGGIHLRLVGDVGGQDERIGQGLAQRRLAPAQQRQRPALAGERAGHGAADARAGAGHQGDLHGRSTRRCTAVPGRKGSASPASQASWSLR